jgi:hypothetical protein
MSTRGVTVHSMANTPLDLLDRYFYFIMSLVIAAVVVYGFSNTIDINLIHPPYPRPLILYFHGAIFSAWVALLMIQSGLIRTRNVKLHRKLGWGGVGLGIAIPIVGIPTGIAMAKFNTLHGATDAAEFLIVPFFDMVVFSIVFGLAILWRTTPEFHRRLMLVASCGLTVAAFNRFSIATQNWGYAGVDALILLGVARDVIVTQRVHVVYLCCLPVLILGQVFTMYVFLNSSPQWLTIAHRLIG